MTILVANIGTSDLSIKLDQPLKHLDLRLADGDSLTPTELKQDYFLPIGFDRNEPNVDNTDLTPAESLLWSQRNNVIYRHLYPSWKVHTFREFTESLLKKYQNNPDEWHPRIQPGRIWGVVQEAIARSVKDVYIFVTDQPEYVDGQKNKGYDSDTVHLFKLLKQWFGREFNHQLTFHCLKIPQEITPVNQDGLFGEYYNFFKQCNPNETILLSVKGGTPQMQTALRVQAISSEVTNQIYLEPQLSVKKILAGEASECDTVSYWRYQQVQKYQAVKQLLNRWDFDGARAILSGWLETLVRFEAEDIAGVGESADRIKDATRALEGGVGYFNLDNDYAQGKIAQLASLNVLSDNYPHRPEEENKQFSKLLNLYTQCCLLWQTDRLAEFLTRMGSFYEETLHELIYAFNGDQYFDRPREQGDWFLQTASLLDHNQKLAQRFYELERASQNWLASNLERNRLIDNGQWVTPIQKWNKKTRSHDDRFKLPGRPTKLNFVYALIQVEGKTEDKSDLQSMVEAMKSLDYWCVKRNKLIHGARGISKERMLEVLEDDRQPQQGWTDRDIENSVEMASVPDESDNEGMTILAAMKAIAKSTQILMKVELPPSVFYSPDGYFESFSEPHYLYSDIREWVKRMLDEDK